MTERERWVVYPLLFLALGAALRDKLVDRTITKSVVCQELSIVDEEPSGREAVRILAKIGHTEGTAEIPAQGYLVVNGEAVVNGQAFINGVLNAKQFGIPTGAWAPMLQLPSGVSLPDFLRAMQAQQKALQSNKRPDGSTPPADEPTPNAVERPAKKD
ncbi:MAG: hypothetical protein IT425_14335 [Pirellulales bacterium]|nr:hypothetical protein [Pirellulales bacterium]